MAREGYLLSVVTFLPLLGSLGLLALRGDDHVWLRRLALATAVANFVLSLLMLRGFDAGTAGYQLEEFYRWILWPPVNYHLGVDGLSLWLVILTTLLTPIAMLASWESIQKRVKEFFIMLLVLETGMIGVFLALDLILFFVFWEVMLVPMYFLIGIWGHERRIYAAIKFVLYTMTGSILMLVAIIWLYGVSVTGMPGGTFDLPALQLLLTTGQIRLAHTTELLLFGAFFLAFAIKVPLFPLHTWLPDAHVEAPTAGSVILAGVLLKMGTYGLLRFCLPLFPAAAKQMAPYVATLAIIGIVYGALVSMVQPDLKKLIAYSSVSHLGFVVLGIFSFHPVAIQGAIYQMLNHGISTGALFLIAGMLYDRRHTHVIKEFGGLATPMPAFTAFFLFVCLSSLGLPMLNGFVGEFLILLGTYQVNKLWATWAALGVIFSAVYLLWAYQRVVFGEVTVEKNRALPDCSARERLILWPLCVMILWMGVGSPLFLSRTETTSHRVIEQMKRPQTPQLARGEPQKKAGAACCAPTARIATQTVQNEAGPK
ncbi:MAG TPA: NADH-quinone oxidoreductase subunit M [Candidatus Acidoferrales bacterium]|nr:NADH-quinone oxidoreductase subunit M [Candidatus Acidoferrales bacterium]